MRVHTRAHTHSHTHYIYASQASLAFYTGVLGFTLLDKVRAEGGGATFACSLLACFILMLLDKGGGGL